MLDKSKKALLLLAFLTGFYTFAPRTACADNPIILPEIGDPSGALLTPSQEQELGVAFFRSLHGNIKVN
ncbi:MAG: M48 family metalloprotease, partial [Methylococcales bacterium]